MNTVLKGYKYRLYPTAAQETQLRKTFGCCRFVYNYFLAMRKNLYRSGQKGIGRTGCNNHCNRVLKQEHGWLKEVDKFALTNAIYALDDAYRNFFRSCKAGNNTFGYPRFRSKKNSYKSYKTNFTNNNIEPDFIVGNQIKLPKLGWVRCKLHRPFTDGRRIISATVSQVPSGKYYVSLNVECSHTLPSSAAGSNTAVGLDLGLQDLLVTSNGNTFMNNKLTYKYERRLAKLQRRLSRKCKGSNNRNKQRIKVARLHEKVANIRLDKLHKISSQIVKENQFIFCEDLNIKGMVRNHNLSKSIHDASWSELVRQLEYKSIWHGRTFHKVDRFFPSSQLCSACGYRNTGAKDLALRSWECPECGAYHDRDVNASINILTQGLKDLGIIPT